MTNKELIDELLAWPDDGPGEVRWNDWIRRVEQARIETDGRDLFSERLAELIADNRDGLSRAQWNDFLRDALEVQPSIALADRVIDRARSATSREQ